MTAVLTTLLLSAFLCGVYLRIARVWRFLDAPNERSSHSLPTPHGGGAALILAFVSGLLLAAKLYGAWDDSFVALALAAVVLMMLGIVDDLYGLSVWPRLIMYAVLCLWLSACLLHGVAAGNPLLSGALVLVATFVLLWSLNLYNFMDGIDGIAAIQAVLACCAAALLSWFTGHEESYPRYCLMLAAAHGGFLVWNFPPARLFMGDAGSVPTGFLLGALALLGAAQGQLNPLVWLILLAAFITDASWTLVWRMASGQAFTQAHRQHAYQRLSRHWDSHLRVDILLILIVMLWLFPLAAALQLWPQHSLFLVLLAYLPLLVGMAKMGRLA
jgi:Fuc2NAc and GlcNAc transferase